mmetsp:Transcript_2121/g.4624  ORF Transcript_2121/g.4624 Transcript_2121/m.4624 type:complete len:223 (+) Transcript_2121:47-715(+)
MDKNMLPLPESESRDQNEGTPQEVEPPLDEDRNTMETGNSVAEDKNPDDDDRASSSSSAASVFQNFTVLRDFFLAAFSDGYNATFCGVEDVTNCCKGSKVAPCDNSLKSSRSAGASFDTSSVQQSASQAEAMKRRRKKPLAVAVGFNYTKDANGRPIIITPTGSRNSPIDLTNVRATPPRGGASAPTLPVLNAQTSSSFTPGVPALRPSQSRYNSQPNVLSY